MSKRAKRWSAAGCVCGAWVSAAALPATPSFGPSNPFFATSTLPFEAPSFDRIKDEDYQPAIEAGMKEQLREVAAIAQNRAKPTFDNAGAAC